MAEDSLSRRQLLEASLTGAVATLAGARSTVAWAQAVASPAARPPGANALNVEAVGYTDLDHRPAFKMAIRAVGDRWYLFTAHFYHAGWSVVDVTDPAMPKVVRFIQWPRNAYTWQVDLSGDVMITALEAARAFPNFGRRDPSDEGVLIWNISDPRDPRLLGQYRTGGTGTHRNFYGGGRYMHLAAGMPGYQGNIYVIVDIADPANPKEAGRWWVPGQHTAGGEGPSEEGRAISLHGPAYVVGDLAYLPYGGAGMIVLDISDVSHPRQIGRLDFSPPFHATLGVHTILPIPERGVAYVNSEDISYGRGPAPFAAIVDITDPAKPFLLSIFPAPVPPPGASYSSFADKPGWSGPHNSNTLQHHPDVQRQGGLFYLTQFNAGLRIYDVSNKRLPIEVGFFMPPEPERRYGPIPEGTLALQTEDVVVDRRGFIYISDKNQGVWIVRYAGPAPSNGQ